MARLFTTESRYENEDASGSTVSGYGQFLEDAITQLFVTAMQASMWVRRPGLPADARASLAAAIRQIEATIDALRDPEHLLSASCDSWPPLQR